GIICLDDNLGFRYQISKIKYVLKEDDSFYYEFKPNYSVIDLLDSRLFQGIPGLNLDLRKEVYTRTNMVPVFISERTPSENREDLWDYLDKYGMKYLNRLEWLIKTDMTYCGDNLYVIEDTNSICATYSLKELGNRSSIICKKLLNDICSGAIINLDSTIIDNSNRLGYYNLIMHLYCLEKTFIDSQRQFGIKVASEKGKYKGRKRTSLDSMILWEYFDKYKNKEIDVSNVCSTLGISPSTFFRRYREYNKKLSN
ncbi:MAG: hypothetical protein HUK24_01055, partial [Sphaerochaetaceae bacterium]|nr:hypothetical protein [Sphaerochaetaceae bacterium]